MFNGNTIMLAEDVRDDCLLCFVEGVPGLPLIDLAAAFKLSMSSVVADMPIDGDDGLLPVEDIDDDDGSDEANETWDGDSTGGVVGSVSVIIIYYYIGNGVIN